MNHFETKQSTKFISKWKFLINFPKHHRKCENVKCFSEFFQRIHIHKYPFRSCGPSEIKNSSNKFKLQASFWARRAHNNIQIAFDLRLGIIVRANIENSPPHITSSPPGRCSSRAFFVHIRPQLENSRGPRRGSAPTASVYFCWNSIGRRRQVELDGLHHLALCWKTFRWWLRLLLNGVSDDFQRHESQFRNNVSDIELETVKWWYGDASLLSDIMRGGCHFIDIYKDEIFLPFCQMILKCSLICILSFKMIKDIKIIQIQFWKSDTKEKLVNVL